MIILVHSVIKKTSELTKKCIVRVCAHDVLCALEARVSGVLLGVNMRENPISWIFTRIDTRNACAHTLMLLLYAYLSLVKPLQKLVSS